MVTIRLSNKTAYSLILILLVLTTSLIAYAYSSVPNPGHGGDGIVINIGGQEKTLQNAIDVGDFNEEIVCPCGECWSTKYKQDYKYQIACLCTPDGWRHTGGGYRTDDWGSPGICDF